MVVGGGTSVAANYDPKPAVGADGNLPAAAQRPAGYWNPAVASHRNATRASHGGAARPWAARLPTARPRCRTANVARSGPAPPNVRSVRRRDPASRRALRLGIGDESQSSAGSPCPASPQPGAGATILMGRGHRKRVRRHYRAFGSRSRAWQLRATSTGWRPVADTGLWSGARFGLVDLCGVPVIPTRLETAD